MKENEKSLYRYISFEDFINLVINNKMRFSRPCFWDDGFEGTIFNKIETKEDFRKIIKELYYKFCSKDYKQTVNAFFRLWRCRRFALVQCWSEYSNSVSMWKNYSYENKAIRIKTTNIKLFKWIRTTYSKHSSVEKVSYDFCEKDGYQQIMNQMKNENNLFEPYIHKRKCFDYEGEYRAIILDTPCSAIEQALIIGINFRIPNNGNGKTDEEIIDETVNYIFENANQMYEPKIDNTIIDIEDIHTILESVMVHPKAPQWYVDIIENICKKMEITFEGKSKVYDFNDF